MKLLVAVATVSSVLAFAPNSPYTQPRSFDVALDAEKGSKRKVALKVRSSIVSSPNLL